MSNIDQQLTPKMHGVEDEAPNRVTNDELYRRSTQYRFWSFTKDELSDLRIKVNARGLEILRKRIDSLSDDSDLLIKRYVNEEFKNIAVEEERQIVTYYARKCSDLSNFFKFTTQVKLSAISYLFKFYLVHSIMEYYPQQIMYTCLFLSAKSENNFIGINNFSKAIPKTTPESILKFEYLILDTMRFTLTCHHPMRPMYGFYLDIQNVLTKLDFNRLCKDFEHCKNLINESVFTSVQFLFTPPQIALAVLYIVDDVVCMRYLMRKFGVKRKQMLEMMKDREESETQEKDSTDNAADNTNGVLKDEKQGSVPEEDENDNEDNEDEDNKEKKPKVKTITPLEHFEKVMNIVKDCASIIQQDKIDPSVQEAKIVSLKTHFVLDPVKYFQKITKEKDSSSSNGTASPLVPSSKREVDGAAENNDAKRIRTE